MNNSNSSKTSPNKEPNKPTLSDEDLDKPIPLGDTSSENISHSPLHLGGDSTAEVTAPPAPVKPTAEEPAEKIASSDRITGVKTFFTKLHAGAIEFLDEQITNWLNKNPDITIKLTNTTTGEIQGKKTEPNIIVTVWY